MSQAHDRILKTVQRHACVDREPHRMRRAGIAADEFLGRADLHTLPFSSLTERTRPPANRQAQPQKRHVCAPRVE